mgnify:CR=1 FL=1
MPVPFEQVVYSRLAFGPTTGDRERLKGMGLEPWLNQQLAPIEGASPLGDEPAVAKQLMAARLHIEYKAGKLDNGQTYDALKEDRPLLSLAMTLKDQLQLTRWDKAQDYAERVRPLAELRTATMIRARYATMQLREVLADFWHNHFHVNAGGDDIRVSVSMPSYDRDVIRRHSLGNFREFLGAVATAPAMLYYLNNAASKASPANENYARELFELHTLGRERYMNGLYNRWRDVPGATEGKPSGYIDQDVYEAARAFTGWTVADGSWCGPGDEHFPAAGAFTYHDAWHDNYQKRVLGNEFDPNQAPMVDGQRVLDLAAEHPGTALTICTKLCRRLVCDDPPSSLIERVVGVWRANMKAKDQISRVVRAIVLSPEFAATPSSKAKRPFELAISFLRAVDGEFRTAHDWFWTLDEMGHRLFAWPSPTGHPDHSEFWLSTNMMVSRWNLPLRLMADWFKGSRVRLLKQLPDDAVSPRAIAKFWCDKILGAPLDDTRMAIIERAAAADNPVDQPLELSETAMADRVQRCVAAIAMTPEFQVR